MRSISNKAALPLLGGGRLDIKFKNIILHNDVCLNCRVTHVDNILFSLGKMTLHKSLCTATRASANYVTYNKIGNISFGENISKISTRCEARCKLCCIKHFRAFQLWCSSTYIKVTRIYD